MMCNPFGIQRCGRGKFALAAPVLAVALLAATFVIPTAIAPPSAVSQTADEVVRSVDATIQTRQDMQHEQDEWEVERTSLIARYRSAQASIGYLEKRRTTEQARLDALQDRIAELQRRVEESVRLESSLEDTLRTVLRRLEESVARDLPFLTEERSLRLASLRQELVRPDIAGAEKLRRLLEALQIEAQYGGTVEVYQDRITVADESIHTDILRLGRLSLFWMTPDGRRAGRYDEATDQWVELPGKYRRSIQRTMEMATRMRPTAIVELPIGRVAP